MWLWSNDGFDDGGRTNGADALDVDWWKVQERNLGDQTLTVQTDDGSPGIGSGNALAVTDVPNDDNRRSIMANIPEISLTNIGDTVVLSFDVRILSSTNSKEDFRFGILNSNGSVQTSDQLVDDIVDNDLDFDFVMDEGLPGEVSMSTDHTNNSVVTTFNEIGFSSNDDNIEFIIDNVVVGMVDPVVDAGDDKYVRPADAGAVELVGEIVNYDSEKSYTYTWSGAGVSFTPPVTVVDRYCPTTATFGGLGTYALTFEVTVNGSDSTSDTVTVAVIEPRDIRVII